jgi:hypothetical protein
VIYEEPLSVCSCLWPYHHQRLGLQTVHRYMAHSASFEQNLCTAHSNSQNLMIQWAHQHQRGLSESCHHQHHEEWRSQGQGAMSCMGASILTNLSSAVVCTLPEKDAICQIILISISSKFYGMHSSHLIVLWTYFCSVYWDIIFLGSAIPKFYGQILQRETNWHEY